MSKLLLPTEYTSQRRAAVDRRLQQMQEVVGQANSILLLLHSDPDPDAIASGLALRLLLGHLAPNLTCILAHGGLVGRSENRSMALALAPDLVRIVIPEIEQSIHQVDLIALIDTQPTAGNHLLYNSGYDLAKVAIAIDHHPPRRSQIQAIYHDVRPEMGACSTILVEYLAGAGLAVDPRLATALFYGIKSDTRGLSRGATETDAWAYMALHGLIDSELLGRIEQANVPLSYFRDLNYALAHTRLYPCPQRGDRAQGERSSPDSLNGDFQDPEPPPVVGGCSGDVLISLLGDLESPDMAAEVADLLLRLQGVGWVICLGIYQERIVISVRGEDTGVHAGQLVRAIVGRSGTAGGHETMAGGRIHLPDATPAERVAAVHALVPQFLHRLGVGEASGHELLHT